MTNFEKLCEETRQGRNICPTCGSPKDMYYRPWCPRCEKPEPYTKQVFNLIQCLRHIAATTGIDRAELSALARDFWKGRWGNDKYVTWPTIELDERDEYDQRYLQFYDLMVSTFSPPDGCLFLISW